MNDEKELQHTGDVEEVLSRISGAPSCLSLGWEHEVSSNCGEGWLIRTSFLRPDTVTGEISRGYGRWWHVPFGVKASGVVKTVYAAMKLILEHELMESFLYDGVRIFDPHRTVDELKKVSGQ